MSDSPIQVYISAYRRYGCIGEYEYKENQFYEDIWGYVSGASWGLVPYYGNARAIVEYQLYVNKQLIRKYEFLTETKELGSILLFPFFWVHFLNGDFREDYFETFVKFHEELARDKVLDETEK